MALLLLPTVLIVILATVSLVSSEEIQKKKLIIDTDPGVDDTAAILLVHSFPRADILAFTTCKGNDLSTQGAANLNRFKRLVGSKTPVYIGSRSNLLPESDNAPDASYYHGKDGLGDVPHAFPAAELQDTTEHMDEHAVQALISLTKKYPGEITLLCIAPLSNIAEAIRLDPDFTKRVKEIYFMGGTMYGMGNINSNLSLTAEYNFWRDPEAAQIVLDQMKCPMTIVPWEVSLENFVDWDWYQSYTGLNTNVSRFLKAITKHSADVQMSHGVLYDFADEFAAGAVMDPSLILEAEEHFATVETKGMYTRGQMIVDWTGKRGRGLPPNVRIIRKFDIGKLKNMLMNSSAMQQNI